MDRTLRHRVVGVQFDLRTDAMQLTGRTALPVASQSDAPDDNGDLDAIVQP